MPKTPKKPRQLRQQLRGVADCLGVDKVKRTCIVDGCEGRHRAHGYCDIHLSRLKRLGTTDAPPPRPTPADRLWSRVEKTESCWLWTGPTNRHGYGHLKLDGCHRGVHRLSYELAHGEIPSGGQIDHTCHVRHCVNPAHLRIASLKQQAENPAGAYRNSQSGIRGVTWHQKRRRWEVTVGHNGKKHHVGYFRNVEDAERAAIKRRCELFTHNAVDRREV